MKPSTAQYDRSYFDFVDKTALNSARTIVPYVTELLKVDSVVDFGCGCGVWLSVWRQMGIDTIVGVDGDYADTDRLMIDRESFVPHDLSTPIDLGRKFSLVQSLEVAEHIDAASADTFIDILQRHGDIVLFSAALPGQCGIQHVNEQPFSYWRDRFSRRGFVLLDPLCPRLLERKDVAWWYRYGLLLYVRKSVFPDLPEQLKCSLVADHERIRDYSPTRLKLQRAVMRWMPSPVTEWCARSYMRRQG